MVRPETLRKTIVKKLIALATAAALSVSLVACSDDSASTDNSAEETSAAQSSNETISIEDNNGTIEVPASAQSIVVTDNRAFELLDSWGVKVAAAPKGLVPKTVPNYKNDEAIVDLGSHREPNLEAMVAVKPDLVINGQRFSQYQEDIQKLNPGVPVVSLDPRDGEPLDEELKRQATTLGKIFGKEAEAEKVIADFEAAVERAKAAYNGNSTVMAVNVSGGEIGYIAPSVGRTFGPIFDLLGLKPALEVEDSSTNHKGDDISVEAIAQSNPEWIFVMDRDGGTSAADEEGYTPAADVIANNEALKNVTALKESQLVFAPADTYTNENIITYTEILNDIADAFEGK